MIDGLPRLLELAEVCAQDLITEVTARYPSDEPLHTRLRNRDCADAETLLKMIAQARAQLQRWNNHG